jgi:hypothetical protein
MKSMSQKGAVLLALFMLMVFSGCFTNLVSAQILGPANVLTAEPGLSDVFVISSPQNISYRIHTIDVCFTVTAYNDIYDVGYSVDHGQIQKVTDLSKVSEVPAPNVYLPPYVQVTYQGRATLPDLPDGNHTLTIYQGYQYTGTNARYDIFGGATAVFSIDTAKPTPAPTPTPTAMSAENVSLSDPQVQSIQQPNPLPLTLTILAVVMASIVATVLAFYFVNRESEVGTA